MAKYRTSIVCLPLREIEAGLSVIADRQHELRTDADFFKDDSRVGVPGGPGYGVPQELFDAVAAGTGDNFEINYLDRSFDLPSEWKYSVGLYYELLNDMALQADLSLTRGRRSRLCFAR